MTDYERTYNGFSWAHARAELNGLAGGALNIAHEAVARHAAGPRAGTTAVRWLDPQGTTHDMTYRVLDERSTRFAAALAALGVCAGDRIFTLIGRNPALYLTAVGTLKAGCVLAPLFTSFGPEPLRVRLTAGEARVLVTTSRLYQRQVAALRGTMPQLEHVILVDGPTNRSHGRGVYALGDLLDRADPRYPIVPTQPADPALLHFTSGTTGHPKGVLHVHEAVVAHYATGRLALDLRPGDVFWCTADPGWVTGVSYGIIAPLVIGATLLVDSGEFDARRWLDNLQRQRVSVWYTAPTAIHMLMRILPAEQPWPALPNLAHVATVGEPLEPEAVHWAMATLGLPLHDTWWQTETGAIMVANTASMDIKPGSMGRPMPGIEAAVVRRVNGRAVRALEGPEVSGELALRAGWPSMFRGYFHDEARYRACFRDDWYLTGDLVRRDRDGYFWFVARADDIITSAGHRIGPFEVESVLMEHPAVAECAVIGKPDALTTQTVKAFIALKPGIAADASVRRQILAHARRRLGAVVAPREIEFRKQLPKTESNKILRRQLREEEGLQA